MEGFHTGTDEWDRYEIHAVSHKEAASLAADLGLWLHCWKWVQSDGREPTKLIDTWS